MDNLNNPSNNQSNQKKRITAKSRFLQLDAARSGNLSIARQCAKLTLPKVLPPEGFSSTSELEYPQQNIGSECVNKLASKLALVLFPPNIPFFRLKIDELELRKIVAPEQYAQVLTEIDENMAAVSRAALGHMTSMGWLASIAMATLSLVITGNSLLIRGKDTGTLRFLRTDKWVCRRDADGGLLELIFVDALDRQFLPPDVAKEVEARRVASSVDNSKHTETVSIYTWVTRDPEGTGYLETKWAEDVYIPDADTKHADSKFLPYIVTPWSLVSGEDYGRGHAEDNLGDLRAIEGLSIAIDEYIAASSRLIGFINPSGVTQANDIDKAPNGAFVSGRAEDVTWLTLGNKAMEIQQAIGKFNDTAQRLRMSFLALSSIQRQAERVTAEEWRIMSGELEDALGSAYSLLGINLQQPIAYALLDEISSGNPLITKSALTDAVITLEVSTGTSGLGRVHEFQSMSTFLNSVSALPGAIESMDTRRLLSRIGALLNLNISGILKTKEELEAEQQQAFQQELMMKAAPNATKGIADAYNQQQQSSQEGEQ